MSDEQGPFSAYIGYVSIDKDGDEGVIDIDFDNSKDAAQDRRTLVALLLEGKSYGFTREDVRHLREVGNAVMKRVSIGGVFGHDWCNSIADRIEALLPPE